MDTTAFEEMEQSGWSSAEIASAYATRFSNATKLVAEYLSESVKAAQDHHILDVCCGHGVVAAALVRRGAVVTGLDFSRAMVALAKRDVTGANFVVGDAMAMGFDDASFDAVTIGFGVPHMPDPHVGLAEAARVLRRGGRLAFSIWQGKGSAGAFGWLFEAYEAHGDPAVTLPPGPDAHAFAQTEVAVPALQALGFSNVAISVANAELIVADPEHVFDAFDQGAVRAAALLSGLSQERRAKIRTVIAERVRSDAVQSGAAWRVPAPVAVVSAILD